jgi:hypothetical protein
MGKNRLHQDAIDADILVLMDHALEIVIADVYVQIVLHFLLANVWKVFFILRKIMIAKNVNLIVWTVGIIKVAQDVVLVTIEKYKLRIVLAKIITLKIIRQFALSVLYNVRNV